MLLYAMGLDIVGSEATKSLFGKIQ